MQFPILDEVARAKEIRQDFMRRLQREIRDQIIPAIDALTRENADLKAQIEKLSKRPKGAAA